MIHIRAIQDNTMCDRWVINEEWVRHIRTDVKDVGIHDMNMGVWCNNQFTLDGYLLLHNQKTIRLQKLDPKKVKQLCSIFRQARCTNYS